MTAWQPCWKTQSAWKLEEGEGGTAEQRDYDPVSSPDHFIIAVHEAASGAEAVDRKSVV